MSSLADMFGHDDAEWMSHPDRLCATGNPDRWFPTSQYGGRQETYAQQLCAGCPVINACATYAVPLRELEGIWGGLNEDGRKRLRNQDAA